MITDTQPTDTDSSDDDSKGCPYCDESLSDQDSLAIHIDEDCPEFGGAA